jgi:RNA polymerase sigma factor (TIGR02999 family)
MATTDESTAADHGRDVTALLLELRDGDREALDRIFPIIYAELHRIAHAQLMRERDGHTLSPTALVHEAYFKLVDVTRVEWRDRTHFLSMAARAMRRILIDYARQQGRQRRGGDFQRVTLDEGLVAAERQADTLLALDLALEELAQLNERLARLVECRFFGGLTEEDTAAVLGVNVRTVRRDWVKARGWLERALSVDPA